MTGMIDPDAPLLLLSPAQRDLLGRQLATQDKWDRRFLDMARLVSTWSKDPSTKVGAVVTDRLRRVVGTGFNGFPRGVEDSEERYDDRDTKLKMVVHAELNALLQAGERARGGTIYVFPTFTGPPNMCTGCAKAAIQAGIVRSVCWAAKGEPRSKWADEIATAGVMCEEAGLRMDGVSW
jgi:dCMP deaminase